MAYNFSSTADYPGIAYLSQRVTQAPGAFHDAGIYLADGSGFYKQIDFERPEPLGRLHRHRLFTVDPERLLGGGPIRGGERFQRTLVHRRRENRLYERKAALSRRRRMV